MATWINNKSFGLTSTVSANAVVLTSDTSGSASEIERVSGTLLTTLGFTAASTLGSGFAANAAAAEASEVATLISLTLSLASASSASNRVVITSTAQGASASVEAVGGTALASLFSGSDFAAGTGVQQDYAMCAAIGYGCAIRLDAENGNRGWNNAGNLVGAYGLSPLTTTVRERLHETLRCNTYEQRQKTRAEFHDGIICRSVNGLHRYIDQAISADWMDARVTEAFKLILRDPDVKAIFVNIFGGIVRCDMIAEGIIAAVKEVDVKVPVIVRLEGTNVEAGKELLKGSGLAITAADDINDGAKKAVAAAKH